MCRSQPAMDVEHMLQNKLTNDTLHIAQLQVCQYITEEAGKILVFMDKFALRVFDNKQNLIGRYNRSNIGTVGTANNKNIMCGEFVFCT